MAPAPSGIVAVGLSLFVLSAKTALVVPVLQRLVSVGLLSPRLVVRVVVPVTGGSGVVLTITGLVWRSVSKLQSAVPVVSDLSLLTVELHLALLPRRQV